MHEVHLHREVFAVDGVLARRMEMELYERVDLVTDSQFAGTSKRSRVSKMFWQPILIRHFDKGWYAGLPDIASTTNLLEGETTLNFLGLRVGKVTKIGKMPVNLFLQPWYTPIHEGAVGKWNIKFNLTFLFPK